MKKGFSLVEVIVSITMFSIMITTILGCYTLANKTYQKEKEYLFFENVCLEINAYSNDFNRNWAIKYYGDDVKMKHYNEKFELVNNISRYTLTYYYNSNNELIVSIKNNDSNYLIIDNLNYGSNRYA